MNQCMKNAPCGYIVMDNQGMITDVNQAFLKIIDYEYEELLGRHLEGFLSPASKVVFHSLFLMQLQILGEVEELYLTFRRNNHEEVPVLLNGKQVMRDGKATIDCVAVKITKRNDYELELRRIKSQLEEAYKMKNDALDQESKLRELFETTLFSINEGIIVTDNQGKVTLMNHLGEHYTGWDIEDALGTDFSSVFSCIDIKTRASKSNLAQEVMRTKKQEILENMILISKDGTERFVMGTSACMVSKNGAITGVVTSFRDITKEYFQEKEIDSFLTVNMDLLCVSDKDGNFHKVNKKFEEVLGYRAEELIGQSTLVLVHKDDVEETLKQIKRLTDHKPVSGFTNRYRCKDGSYKYLEWHTQPGVGKYTYSSARDVTDKIMKEEHLLNIAVRDELTGLYNRHYFNMILENEMERADLYHQSIALAILDLDRFKEVNDTWGHPIGDAQLKHTAEITINNLRKSDLFIRFGGEEFVVLMPQTSLDGAILAMNNVREALEKNEYSVTGKQTVSIGVAERLKSESFQNWYKRADEALYQAKQAGRNKVVAWQPINTKSVDI